MKVLHVLNSLSSDWGGPVPVALGIAKTLTKENCSCTIAAAKSGRHRTPVKMPEGVALIAEDSGLIGELWAGHSSRWNKTLPSIIAKHDVVHIHELWGYIGYVSAKLCRAAGKPYVVSVHGGLEEWALRQKHIKKKLYFKLLQGRILEDADLLFALSGKEKQQIKQLGIKNDIVVIPNGVEARSYKESTDVNEFLKTFPKAKNRKLIAFLGRLHKKKGLDLAVEMLKKIVQQNPTILLVVAGPDFGYRKEVERLACAARVEGNLLLTGPLYGDLKYGLLSAAQGFILPSYSEGFSMALLEALAAGVPVVISDKCNFPEVETAGAGFIVPPKEEQLATAVQRLLDLSFSDLERMGNRGKRLANDAYSWSEIGKRYLNIYKGISESRGHDQSVVKR